MNPHYSDATKRFLIAVGLCMQNEIVETKARRVKYTPSLKVDSFTRSQKKLVTELLNKLWGTQVDEVTRNRVLMALGGDTQDILAASEANIKAWGDKIWQPGMTQAAAKVGNSLAFDIGSEIGQNVFFDLSHSSIQEWLTKDAAELVVNMTRQQILGIKYAVKFGVKNKWSFAEMKLMLKQGMTMTDRETIWAANHYQKQYDMFFKQYIDDGHNPLNAGIRARRSAKRRQDRYIRKTLDNRQERIAQTELKRAYGQSQQSGFTQAVEQGKIKNVRKTWRRTQSEDNHPSTIANDGVTVPLDKPWTGDGVARMYPDEIFERCIQEIDYEAVGK